MNADYSKSAETTIGVVDLTETENTVSFSGKKKESTNARGVSTFIYVSSAKTRI
jgi:hypothetical protein